jgi:hypothetical protein
VEIDHIPENYQVELVSFRRLAFHSKTPTKFEPFSLAFKVRWFHGTCPSPQKKPRCGQQSLKIHGFSLNLAPGNDCAPASVLNACLERTFQSPPKVYSPKSLVFLSEYLDVCSRTGGRTSPHTSRLIHRLGAEVCRRDAHPSSERSDRHFGACIPA